MLELLSQVFSVSIEELIYGEKNKVGLEPTKSDSRKIIKIILASLGSLFTFIGLIIIFVSVWDDIPDAFLAVMMFLPLLGGASIAAFAYAKRKDSVSWCEGASVGWSAGFIATVALVMGNFDVPMDFTFVLIVCAIMILPIAFILKTGLEYNTSPIHPDFKKRFLRQEQTLTLLFCFFFNNLLFSA